MSTSIRTSNSFTVPSSLTFFRLITLTTLSSPSINSWSSSFHSVVCSIVNCSILCIYCFIFCIRLKGFWFYQG